MKSLFLAVAVVLSSSAALAQPAELRHGPGPAHPGPQSSREVLLERKELTSRLERLERLLKEAESRLDKKSNSRDKVRKAMEELEDLQRMVARAPEAHGGYQRPEPLPPPRPVVQPVHESRLQEITRAVARESFSREKLTVLREAVRNDNFLVSQTKRVLEQFSFSNDKLEAVRILWPRVLDRNNAFQLYESFTHSSDKEKLRKILES